MSQQVMTFQDKTVALAILGKMQKRHPKDEFAISELAHGFTVNRVKKTVAQVAEPNPVMPMKAGQSVVGGFGPLGNSNVASKPAKPVQVAAPKPDKPKIKWKPELGYYSGVSFKMAAPFVDETPQELFFTFNGKAASVLKKDLVGFYVEDGMLAMKMSAAYAKKRGFL